MGQPTSKPGQLDRRYLEKHREVSRAIWPFLKTASDVFDQLDNFNIHNPLFCHTKATRRSVVEVDGELNCYCCTVARLFEMFGLRPDLHPTVNEDVEGNLEAWDVNLWDAFKDADEDSWYQYYRERYEFVGTRRQLKSAMAAAYREIYTELLEDDFRTREKTTEIKELTEPPEEDLKERTADPGSREINNFLDHYVQEEIRQAVEEEEEETRKNRKE